MRQIFLNLLTPPQLSDADENHIAKFLHVIILTIAGILLVTGIIVLVRGNYASAAAAGALLVPVVISYWINRIGRTVFARYIILLSTILGLTLLLAVGQGIHDIAIINYGLILILTSYLMQRRGVIVVTLTLVFSAAIIVFGEFYGWLPVQNTPDKFKPELSDLALVAFFLIMGGVAIFLLSRTLQTSLEQSRIAEARWRSLVDSIPDIVAILDREGIIQSLNHAPAQVTAFYVNKSAFEMLARAEVPFTQAEFEHVLAGNTLRREAELLIGPSQARWCSVNIGPIYQSDGSVNGVMAIIRDIQEKKDAETELRQSRESLRARTQQLETLQKINRSVSTLKDLSGTLRLALDEMQAVLPLDGFEIVLYDQETNMLSFPLVYDDGKIYQEESVPLYPQNIIADAIYTGQPHILNRTEEQVKNFLASPQKRLGTTKVSASVLTAPMLFRDKVIGTLSVHSYAYNTYHAEHAVILSGAATQIAIAIENARLYEVSQAKAEQLAALNEIGYAISTLRDLNTLLESAYRLLKNVLPLDAFYIALYHPEDNTVSYPIILDNDKKWSEKSSQLASEGLLTRTILTGEPYLVNRSNQEVTKQQASPTTQNMLGDLSKVSASLMLAPLRFGDTILGAVSAQSYQLNAYTSESLELLIGVATQVAIAIVNTRLYTALQKELAERKRAEAEVRNLNADLEARVHLRTKELEAVNKELTSFAYTVSHDLRAPIRGIHGLSNIFIEEFEKDLPAESIAYIERIQNTARQMGRLIDELLAFIHLGQYPVRKIDLDMGTLVQNIITELMKKETRPIDFSIQHLPNAYGDPALLRRALANLLANAIQFTAKQKTPQVKIGSLTQDGETVYFIRDNGVGFDMAYSKKLFGIFERLHRQDEFEGVGIGLAIVHRIITKHEGRIWAEGKINEGATFFFTLPPKPKRRKRT